MSKWNDLFGITEDTTEQKKTSTHVKSSTKKHSQTTHTSIMPEGSRITKDDLETLQNNILKAMNHMIPQGLETHIFHRKNLILFIGKRGSRGTKLCELRDFFYPTPASVIDTEVQKLRKERILKKNRNGWISLTNKSP